MTGPVLSHLGETRLELGPAHGPPADGHWRLARDEAGIAWLVLDREGAGTNTLSGDVLRELARRLDEIEEDRPKALVVRSAKPNGFAAGADIAEFRGADDVEAVKARLAEGHAVLDRLAALPFPTIAVAHGFCLGGGFEIALACDRRIAVDGASFGFPEVRLGLHPGLGGTFRLTGLIDPVEAMTMMLTGRTAHTARARKLGIVDAVTQERHVGEAVRRAADGRIGGRDAGLRARAFSLQPARAYAARRMRQKTGEQAREEHYPAPYALVDLWERHGGDRDAMQRAEIDSFAHLVTGETAPNLVRVFFLREQLKSLGRGDHGIRHVHVIGAGAMGGEIAAWCAIRGLTVTLGDVAREPIGRAVAGAAKLCRDQHLSPIETRDALDRLIPDPKGLGVPAADLIIEAAPEKPELKRRIYAGVEPRMKPGAILATNTSSLGLPELTEGLADAGRFAGLHFFNPVSKMQLVEVVGHDGAGDATLRRLRAFTDRIGRLPAPVRSYPGFLVNRALTPYLLEAIVLMDEGVAKETVDAAAERFGMPMGPVELADQIGLDVCVDVGESLRANLGRPMPEIPCWLREKVRAGKLGRKTGEGFYVWRDGKAHKRGDASHVPEDLADRLILPMLDACVECLRQGVVEGEDVVDGAMVFGTGFAPFRGGPMHYARRRGAGEIVARLRQLAAAHGARFQPDEGWSRFG
jgi:3-hydroxyacyl-CoA dehydrogenase/enoyl-CoA hydratase/3-hydroxybutyryl-CoA epimerase